MRSRRPIAIFTCIFLLLGQYASVLHAVDHFSLKDNVHHHVLKHDGHEHISFSFAGNDKDASGDHLDLACLVFHLHGSAQATLSTSADVLVISKVVRLDAGLPAQAIIEDSFIHLAIRGPPIVS